MSITKQVPRAPLRNSDDGYGLSLADIIRILRRWLPIILVVSILLPGFVMGFSLFQTPMYEASTTLLIGQTQRGPAATNLNTDIEGLRGLAPAVVQAVDSQPVAEATIQQLDLGESPGAFLTNLSVQQIGTTPFIKVAYRSPSPEEAKVVANNVAEVAADQVSKMNVSTTGTITLTVWQEAVASDNPVSPKLLRNGLLALVLGALLGVVLAFLLEYLSGARIPDKEPPAYQTKNRIPDKEAAGRSIRGG